MSKSESARLALSARRFKSKKGATFGEHKKFAPDVIHCFRKVQKIVKGSENVK